MTHITGARGTARRPGHLFSHEEAPRGPIFAERRRGCASWFIESNFSRPLEVWRVRAVPWVTDYYLVTRFARRQGVSACCTAGWCVATLITKSCQRVLIVFSLRATWQRINCIPFDEHYCFRLYCEFVNCVAKLQNLKIAKLTPVGK